ncbi:MAG: biotin--[acetyl-CoA-carboxylase] ligase [Spirochaetales bacterium]|nr:biotin--[acetyl-CoA-carboxylase] ligase [Spirochaetales bacterium]
MNDFFSDKTFLDFFSPDEAQIIQGKISLVESIDSTNTFLMKESEKYFPLLSESGELTSSGKQFNFSLKAAASQTKGRGRMGREFISPISSGIYFSIAYVKETGICDPAMVTASVCTGICRAIEKTYGVECKIKWVNDIYCNGKKVCGILTEGIINPAAGRIDGCVIGIGINLRTNSAFDGELKSKAGGILDGLKEDAAFPCRAAFLAACYKEVKHLLVSGEDFMEDYKSRSLLTGRTVTVTPVIGDEKTSYTATVKGISDRAELVVELSDGTTRNLSSGEVSLHGTVINN